MSPAACAGVEAGVCLPQSHQPAGPRLEAQMVTSFYRLLQKAPAPKLVSAFLKATNPRGHAWKYMALGPDGWLYIAVGSPCDK